uniref:Glutamine amidotransferase domain-containing protein n=1 Tax=Ananas comosus var. bracteatus TaxID=296719 RepID=A0A6V7NIC3_ANACO|nr:unnamed protein product [Ananas comosus var. bracteatus]
MGGGGGGGGGCGGLRRRRRRYAVLVCAEEEPDHVRRAHGGYFGVFAKLLATTTMAPKTMEEEEEGYDGFVVTGSCSDAHGDDPWITDLVRFLQKLIACRKKVLGICFGHQVPARQNASSSSSSSSLWNANFLYPNNCDRFYAGLGGRLAGREWMGPRVTCIHPSHSTIKRLSRSTFPLIFRSSSATATRVAMQKQQRQARSAKADREAGRALQGIPQGEVVLDTIYCRRSSN